NAESPYAAVTEPDGRDELEAGPPGLKQQEGAAIDVTWGGRARSAKYRGARSEGEREDLLALNGTGNDRPRCFRLKRRHIGHVLARYRGVAPLPRRQDVRPVEMPGQFQQGLLLRVQLYDIERVVRSGDDAAHHGAVLAARPAPVISGVERFTRGVFRLLGSAIETGGVVRQRGAVPEKITGDVRAGPEIRKPMHPGCMDGEVQAVRVAMAAGPLATFEADVAISPSKNYEPLGGQEHAGRGHGLHGRELRQHVQQRIP